MLCTSYRLTRNASDSNDGRIYGTWDFKWPQGTTIRVAFQEWLRDSGAIPERVEFDTQDPAELKILADRTGYARLTRIVECLARRWLARTPSIDFKFEHDTYIPRRPEEPTDQAFRNSADDLYDVLISLAPLPQHQKRQLLQADGTTESHETKYFLPGSELGRYAQRIDYGVPSTYLGKREHLAASPAEYFSSPEFHHWVVHEFGHVLGLPHEQQNPNINHRIQLKEKDELVKILQTALGYPPGPVQDITPAEIEEEIIQPWPTLPGAPYCDFRTYDPGVPIDDTTSVMFHLFWERLTADGKVDAKPRYYDRPHDRDLDAVSKMYPQRVAARQDATPSPPNGSDRGTRQSQTADRQPGSPPGP
jgi:hypothetical protein